MVHSRDCLGDMIDGDGTISENKRIRGGYYRQRKENHKANCKHLLAFGNYSSILPTENCEEKHGIVCTPRNSRTHVTPTTRRAPKGISN